MNMRLSNKLLALLAVGLLLGCAANKRPYIPPEHTYKHDPPPEPELPQPSVAELERVADRIFGSGNLPLAFIKYQQALEKEPRNVRLLYKKGLTLVAGQKFDDAIAHFNKSETIDSDFPYTYEGLGLAQYGKNDLGAAETYFEKAIHLDQHLWRSHAYLGMIHQNRNDYGKAIAAYGKAIENRPGDGSLYNNIGSTYYLAGQFESAVKAFEKATALKYSASELYNNLALSLAALERYPEAQKAFEKAGSKAQAFNNMGCVYMQLGFYGQAVDSFEKALESQPQFYKRAHENLLKAKKARVGMVYNN